MEIVRYVDKEVANSPYGHTTQNGDKTKQSRYIHIHTFYWLVRCWHSLFKQSNSKQTKTLSNSFGNWHVLLSSPLCPSGACTSACFRRQLSEGKRCGHSQANQTKRTIVWRQIQIHFVESTAILYLCISDTFHCFGQYSIVSLFWMQSAFTNICFLSHFVRGNKKQFPAKFLTMGTNSLLYSNILKERHVSRPKHLQNVYSKFDLFYLLWYW